MDKAIEAAARALSPHLRFYGDGYGHAVTIAGKTIKAFLAALVTDEAAIERVARAICAENEVSEDVFTDQPLHNRWIEDARAALSALEVE